MNKLILAFTLLTFSTSLQSQTMHIVNAGNYYYQPSDLSISQGDSVKFVNDNGYHDVLITSGPEALSLPACSGPCRHLTHRCGFELRAHTANAASRV